MVSELRADDRVLLLHIPLPEQTAAVARVLMKGVLVAIGSRPEVDRARATFAEFDNVMFVEADPTRIPWRDAYFTKIVVAPHLESLMRTASSEWNRVLAPGGKIVTETLSA